MTRIASISSAVWLVVPLLLSSIALVGACGKSEDAGAEQARREAEEELKKKAAQPSTARKVAPPVPGQARIPCEQLIDTAGFTTALGESEPMAIKDVTSSKAEATSSCSLLRGGKRPSPAEQEAMLKRQRRLGVIPGDEVCNVTAYCWTIEDEPHFKERCKQLGNQADESLGFFACVQSVAQGADDVSSFRFLDADTKCVLQVRGGPSMIDNAVISSCAKAASELIGPANIAVGGAPAGEPAAPAAGGSDETAPAQ
jgi:hypothetical protein